jgi:hypothetical protein
VILDYQQQQAEINRAKRRRANTDRQSGTIGQVASYVGRDARSGYRQITEADGGVNFANYLSNAQPAGVPELSIGSRLGSPGIINSKPA